MTDTTETSPTVQLDRSTRSEVEGAVLSMRSTAEADLRYQLTDRYGLDDPETVPPGLSEEQRERRSALREAIERERVDGHDLPDALERYVQGTGYTVVNRLAALRCMEARGFLDRPVTQLREDGCTPAADPLIQDEFLPRDEALLEAYRRACDGLAEEVELLFDRGSAYSRLEPRPRKFEELCRTLEEVPETAWRADDVLGWVYQYYHIDELDELRSKAGREGLDPEDVAPANQFYTPHWVVRMLTDNSLGKLYLERVDGLESAVEAQEPLSPEERKHRLLDPEETPTVADLCTYLVPGSEAGESTEWSDPSELRVIDPACGSGHFLLYAFDVLERIWWAERPEVPRAEVPSKILRYNLYGVDIDLRACQLAAFNLYLKARTRAEAEGAEGFELPPLNIVCADARVAEIEEAEEVFAEVTEEDSRERAALGTVLETFRGSYGLGSLLDVKGTLKEELAEQLQKDLFDEWAGPEELLHGLVQAVERRRGNGSFFVRDLKSFLRLLEVLAGDYDVALMNPPYGSRNRMPKVVKDYVKDRYEYPPEYYINFFEVCDRLAKSHGRVGMLVPRTFMFKKTYQPFREDFVGDRGAFDFLAEYGLGVLDNATVRTVGTVIRKERRGADEDLEGLFLRLHDKETDDKEPAFLRAICGAKTDEEGIQRIYRRTASEFRLIPGAPLSYWVPLEIRELYESPVVFDADNAGLERDSLGAAKQGLATGDDSRFYRYFWEVTDYDRWKPLAKGGEDAFVLPRITHVVLWEDSGKEIKRYSGSRPQNTQYFFRKGVTWTYIKETGRRFGYLPKGSIFSHTGFALIGSFDIPAVLTFSNSALATYLMLAQTTGRHWNIGEISKLPWDESFGSSRERRSLSEELLGLIVEDRRFEVESPFFEVPRLWAGNEASSMVLEGLRHPYRQQLEVTNNPVEAPDAGGSGTLEELQQRLEDRSKRTQARIDRLTEKIDREVFSFFEIGESRRKEILTEIELRTAKSSEARSGPNVGSRRDARVGADLREKVASLLHYLSLRVLGADEDGVVPLQKLAEDEELDLLDRVIGHFEDGWGDHASDRLREADQALGAQAPSGAESYPNLRTWLNEDLFAYHTSTFENTPFLWRLTTARLVPDAKGEGFGCVIDYHQLSDTTFDTLSQRYLQPRRAALRERRDAADERRRDQSVPAAERGEAEEEFQRCRSGIEQIEALEEALRELARRRPRDWSEDDQAVAEELGPKVARFRERVEKRLATLDRLWETATDAWLEETFSPTFWKRVQENRGEWIDAPEDLETACEAYAKPADQPVEAHLYDLFVYYQDDLIGSTHYSSNGIFVLNYYFSKGEKYLTEEGELRSGLQASERLLAELAQETDADIELGREIAEGCKELADRIPSDWEERALAEVTTAGYRPVKKHGVRINITPLAEAGLVPELVEKKVL